jgi:hypothetical protein
MKKVILGVSALLLGTMTFAQDSPIETKSDVIQRGGGNESTVWQEGRAEIIANVTQEGNGNMSNVRQDKGRNLQTTVGQKHDNNDSYVEQFGWNNTVKVVQFSTAGSDNNFVRTSGENGIDKEEAGNRSVVEQGGQYNDIDLAQQGKGNNSYINQQGFFTGGNETKVFQNGDDNSNTIYQGGKHNKISVTQKNKQNSNYIGQSGYKNTVDVVQLSEGNFSSIDQHGGHWNKINVHQMRGKHNSSRVDQDGDYLTSRVGQSGENNESVVKQRGEGSTASVLQIGNGNYAKVNQTLGAHSSRSIQGGTNNGSFVTQYGAGSGNSAVNQQGVRNISNVKQHSLGSRRMRN